MDSRKHPRVHLDAWIRAVTDGGQDHLCAVHDISMGGALLMTSIPPLPPVSEFLEVRLCSPSAGEATIECEVIHHLDAQRFGVRFLGLSAAARALLESMIASSTDDLVSPGEYAIAGSAPRSDGPAQDPGSPAPGRRRVRTLVMDETDLSPLVAATRPAAELPPPQRTPEQGPRTSSDLVKALRSATGESRAVPGSPAPPGSDPPLAHDSRTVPEAEARLGDMGQVPFLQLSPRKIPWERLESRREAEIILFLITGTRAYRDILEAALSLSTMSRATAAGILVQLRQLGVISVVAR